MKARQWTGLITIWILVGLSSVWAQETYSPTLKSSNLAGMQPVTDSLFDTYWQQALRWNPAIKVARHEYAQFAAQLKGIEGFFDPQLYVAGGHRYDLQSIPGLTGGIGLVSKGSVAEAGIERPFFPGFYGSLGVGQQYLEEVDSDGNHLHRSIIGGQIRIPLWRDRGFREFDLQKQSALLELEAARFRLIEAIQRARYDVTIAYIDLLEQQGLWLASQQATARVRTLEDNTKRLVELKTVPEFQVNHAQLEVLLRLEEEVAARESLDRARVTMQKLIGKLPNEPDQDPLKRLSDLIENMPDIQHSLPTAVAFRGGLQDLQTQAMAAETDLNLAREQTKSRLELKVAATYAGESDEDFIGNDPIVLESRDGYAAELVLTRPLSRITSKAKVREEQSRTSAAWERWNLKRAEVGAALVSSYLSWSSARVRYELAGQAVQSAKSTLSAETQRFQEGGGDSRSVLDAQKDLTNSIRLQTRNAARLLRAFAEHHFEAGYPAYNAFADLARPDETDGRDQ